MDPGHVQLIFAVVVDDFSSNIPKKGEKQKSTETTFHLSAKQSNIQLNKFCMWEKRKKVKDKINEIESAFPKKKDQHEYLTYFWKHYEELYNFYSIPRYLNWKFRIYTKKQQLLEEVVKKFSKKTVCAFGVTHKQMYSPIIKCNFVLI